MAKDSAPTTDNEEWEDLSVGIGEEWDFAKNGPLVGYLVNKEKIELPERSWTPQADGSIRKDADVWKFALVDTGEEVFIWDSYQLTEALTEAGYGDKVRISFEGMQDIAGGSRRVKRYKVQRAKK